MNSFEKSQARGREALLRERAAREVAGGDRSPRTMRTHGVFSEPSYIGVGHAGVSAQAIHRLHAKRFATCGGARIFVVTDCVCPQDPAPFDPVGKARESVLAEALRHSIAVPFTEKTHVKETADPTAPPWYPFSAVDPQLRF